MTSSTVAHNLRYVRSSSTPCCCKNLQDGLPQTLGALLTPFIVFQQHEDGIFRRSDAKEPASLVQGMSVRLFLLDLAIGPVCRECNPNLL